MQTDTIRRVSNLQGLISLLINSKGDLKRGALPHLDTGNNTQAHAGRRMFATVRSNVRQQQDTTVRDQATSVYWEWFRVAVHWAVAPLRESHEAGQGEDSLLSVSKCQPARRDFEKPPVHYRCLNKNTEKTSTT